MKERTDIHKQLYPFREPKDQSSFTFKFLEDSLARYIPQHPFTLRTELDGNSREHLSISMSRSVRHL